MSEVLVANFREQLKASVRQKLGKESKESAIQAAEREILYQLVYSLASYAQIVTVKTELASNKTSPEDLAKTTESLLISQLEGTPLLSASPLLQQRRESFRQLANQLREQAAGNELRLQQLQIERQQMKSRKEQLKETSNDPTGKLLPGLQTRIEAIEAEIASLTRSRTVHDSGVEALDAAAAQPPASMWTLSEILGEIEKENEERKKQQRLEEEMEILKRKISEKEIKLPEYDKKLEAVIARLDKLNREKNEAEDQLATLEVRASRPSSYKRNQLEPGAGLISAPPTASVVEGRVKQLARDVADARREKAAVVELKRDAEDDIHALQLRLADMQKAAANFQSPPRLQPHGSGPSHSPVAQTPSPARPIPQSPESVSPAHGAPAASISVTTAPTSATVASAPAHSPAPASPLSNQPHRAQTVAQVPMFRSQVLQPPMYRPQPSVYWGAK